jgi:DNA-binding HxlR family transcriptional regulator
VKSYGQLCPLARALDVVGDRWAMLVVRELGLGPRRYTDLAGGLPGIGTNVLATRLADLQQAGVVSRRTLPAPAPATVYELTEAGRALRPALDALREWGAAYGRPPSDGDILRPGWPLLRTVGRATPLGAGDVVELTVDADVFTLTGGDEGLAVRSGGDPNAQASITLDLDTFARLLNSGSRPSATEVTGDPALANRALDTLAGALS